jgi:hypothetical protein
VTNPKDIQRQMLDEGFWNRLILYLKQAIKLDFDWSDEPDEIEIYGRARRINFPIMRPMNMANP